MAGIDVEGDDAADGTGYNAYVERGVGEPTRHRVGILARVLEAIPDQPPKGMLGRLPAVFPGARALQTAVPFEREMQRQDGKAEAKVEPGVIEKAGLF